jgi:hypothetical protein
MKHWVFTWRVEPPVNTVVSVRFGPSVCFAAYSKVIDQWYLVANGKEEKIAEPPMIFLEGSYIEDHPRNIVRRREKPFLIRQKKQEQLRLFT